MVAPSHGDSSSCGDCPHWSGDSVTHRLFGCKDGIHLCSGTCPPIGLRGAGMWVRLTRRLADCIDGVDLSAHKVGDVFEVTRHEAELLVAEVWAVLSAPAARQFRSGPPDRVNRPNVDRRQLGPWAERLRTITQHISDRPFQHQDRRRAEDRIRDEWHDAHATVINHNGDTSR